MKVLSGTTETIYTTEGANTGTDLDDEANEFYLSQIHDREREYLSERRMWPHPCAWCGGRLVHSAPCRLLQCDWKLATPMPFGKYRGKPVAELPIDYVQWAVRLGHLPTPVLDAMRERVANQGREGTAAQ